MKPHYLIAAGCFWTLFAFAIFFHPALLVLRVVEAAISGGIAGGWLYRGLHG